MYYLSPLVNLERAELQSILLIINFLGVTKIYSQDFLRSLRKFAFPERGCYFNPSLWNLCRQPCLVFAKTDRLKMLNEQPKSRLCVRFSGQPDHFQSNFDVYFKNSTRSCHQKICHERIFKIPWHMPKKPWKSPMFGYPLSRRDHVTAF